MSASQCPACNACRCGRPQHDADEIVRLRRECDRLRARLAEAEREIANMRCDLATAGKRECERIGERDAALARVARLEGALRDIGALLVLDGYGGRLPAQWPGSRAVGVARTALAVESPGKEGV